MANEKKTTVAEDVKAVKAAAKNTAEKTAAVAKNTAEKATATAKKTVAKTATAAKKTATKTATAAKKVAKSVEKKESIVIQFGGKEITNDALTEAVKADFKANNKGSIKSLDIYVKPEDCAAYYVVNGKVEGRIEL